MNRTLLALLLAGLAVAARAPQAADQFDGVRDLIRKQMTERQVPSVAVAVARDGRIIWEEAFGWADREKRIAATPHTLYSLASISKPITATGLMILKERGLVDLDRPINEYLGDAKLKVRIGPPEAATVRRVANHTAGLPLHYQFFYEDERYRAPTRDETILRYANTVTAPGERWHYSNLGYGILDHVISRVGKLSYRDFMRREVFGPLGLTHMSVDLDEGLASQQAVRYGMDGLPIPFYGFDHPGGSAVYASAHDLARFALFHLKAKLPDQKPILSDASIDEMQQPTADAGGGQGYGIGWMTADYPGGRRSVSHTGGMGGVSTSLRMFPSDKIAIVVLTNAGSHPVTGMVTEAIVTALLPGAVRTPPTLPAPSPFAPGELVGTWTGKVHTYAAEMPLTLDIKSDGDIHARLGTQLQTLVNRPMLANGLLTGTMQGDIGTEDASRTPHTLSLTLRLRDTRLVGGVTAMSLPARRVGNALTYWVELRKE